MAPKKDSKKRPKKPQFEVGERVLCYHGSLLYEAECVKVSVKYRKVKYLIHYPGGNEKGVVVRTRLSEKLAKMRSEVAQFPTEDDFGSKDVICLTTGWDDEWVPESRLLKYSEANLQKQKELFQAHQEMYAKKEKGGASGKTSESPKKKPVERVETPSVSTQAESGGSRSRDEASTSDQPPRWRRKPLESSEGGGAQQRQVRRHDFKINIPQELKPWLVNDWNLITVQKKLFSLPARKNVESILEDYELYEKTYATTEDKIYAVPEIVAGIRAYFNLMLSSHLLYKFEKPQHAAIVASNPTVLVSQVYGAPHLLRLFVKIGDMLSYAFFDSHSTNLLLRYLHDFVKYLADNSAALFSSDDYELASPEYLLKAAEDAEPTSTAGSSK
uniref:Uncharacterized protein n=1 Tax=Monodelphis domestica TaxID=13616 RepID=F7FEY8_MONDO